MKRQCSWVPGPALAGRPGMTILAVVVDAWVPGSSRGMAKLVSYIHHLNESERYTVRARSYQLRESSTMRTTESITGTSTSTPTTVASAAPD
jgi:hypothetical protein